VWDGTGKLVSEAEFRVNADPTVGQVEVTTIDVFAAEQQLDRIALIKVDVEGWEAAVLRGAARVIDACRPAIVFEYDPAYVARSASSGAELSSWLHARGYRLFALSPRASAAPLDVLGTAGTLRLLVHGRSSHS